MAPSGLATAILFISLISLSSATTVTPAVNWTVYENHQCEGIGGMDTDLLRDWNGTVDQCKDQCIALGSECVGFVRVHNASSSAGKCYFRSTAMQVPYPYSEDDRDCYILNVFHSTSDNQSATNSTYSDICVSNINPTFDGQYIYDGHANGAPSWWKSGDIDYFLYKTGDWFLITADSGKGWDWTAEHGVSYCHSVSADGTNPNSQSKGGDCLNQWEYYDDTANTFISTPALIAYGQCSASFTG